jgi:hypothetical protein
MKAHELLQRLPAENAAEILEYLYAKEKPAYRHCLQMLASRRKLRPVVLERKSRPERHFWMISELVRKANDDAATEVLRTWLLGNHREMVCSFLDSLGVPHDRGLLDTLPPSPRRRFFARPWIAFSASIPTPRSSCIFTSSAIWTLRIGRL